MAGAPESPAPVAAAGMRSLPPLLLQRETERVLGINRRECVTAHGTRWLTVFCNQSLLLNTMLSLDLQQRLGVCVCVRAPCDWLHGCVRAPVCCCCWCRRLRCRIAASFFALLSHLLTPFPPKPTPDSLLSLASQASIAESGNRLFFISCTSSLACVRATLHSFPPLPSSHAFRFAHSTPD